MLNRQKAIHESGHAAIAFMLELKIEYVTITRHIVGGIEVDGLCKWDVEELQALHGGDPTWMRKKAAFYIAGIEAERRYLQENGAEENPDYWVRDAGQFAACVKVRKDALGTSFSAVADEIEQFVKSLIYDCEIWDGLNRIADELCASDFISGEKAKAVFGKLLPHAQDE